MEQRPIFAAGVPISRERWSGPHFVLQPRPMTVRTNSAADPYGRVIPQEIAADHLDVSAGVALLLLEALRHPVVATIPFAGRHRLDRRTVSSRVFAAVQSASSSTSCCAHQHALRCERVPDAAAEASYALRDAPEHTAAIGTGVREGCPGRSWSVKSVRAELGHANLRVAGPFDWRHLRRNASSKDVPKQLAHGTDRDYGSTFAERWHSAACSIKRLAGSCAMAMPPRSLMVSRPPCRRPWCAEDDADRARPTRRGATEEGIHGRTMPVSRGPRATRNKYTSAWISSDGPGRDVDPPVLPIAACSLHVLPGAASRGQDLREHARRVSRNVQYDTHRSGRSCGRVRTS